MFPGLHSPGVATHQSSGLTEFSGMTSFVIIIISANFQLKQLSAKFLPLTITNSFCSTLVLF